MRFIFQAGYDDLLDNIALRKTDVDYTAQETNTPLQRWMAAMFAGDRGTILCSDTDSVKDLSRCRWGLFLPAAWDGWGYGIRTPNQGQAKACVEHPGVELDLCAETEPPPSGTRAIT